MTLCHKILEEMYQGSYVLLSSITIPPFLLLLLYITPGQVHIEEKYWEGNCAAIVWYLPKPCQCLSFVSLALILITYQKTYKSSSAYRTIASCIRVFSRAMTTSEFASAHSASAMRVREFSVLHHQLQHSQHHWIHLEMTINSITHPQLGKHDFLPKAVS
jgi:hypothetical protein